MNGGFRGVARGYKGLQDVTWAYSGLQRGYCELQWSYIIVAGGLLVVCRAWCDRSYDVAAY